MATIRINMVLRDNGHFYRANNLNLELTVNNSVFEAKYTVVIYYLPYITSGILISHHIFQMLVRSRQYKLDSSMVIKYIVSKER